MAFADILYDKNAGVARITINRPEVYNALRGRTTDEMVVALQDADADESIRVIVIAGAGPNAFCSGRDQSEDRTSTEYGGTSEDSFTDLIRSIPKPVIAMVDGFAIGSGNILAYMCDFTVASTRSTFGQTGPRVGSPAAGFGVAYLAQVVGQKRAREIFFLGRDYSAQDAFEMGMVNAVVDHEDLEKVALEWASEIVAKSPTAQRMIKFALNLQDDGIVGQQLFAGEATRLTYATEEAKEGRDAFLEKRDQDYSRFPWHF